VVLSGACPACTCLVSKDHCAGSDDGVESISDAMGHSCRAPKGCSRNYWVIGIGATDNNTLGIPLNCALALDFREPGHHPEHPTAAWRVAVQRAGLGAGTP